MIFYALLLRGMVLIPLGVGGSQRLLFSAIEWRLPLHGGVWWPHQLRYSLLMV